MTYKSECWVWINQTTTGCANCYYCWNGLCAYGRRCYGTKMVVVNGNWTQMPIGAPNEERNEWAIKLKKITLLYGHLYQIDYYNDTKKYHGRMFIEKEQINNAEIADDDVVLQNNTILSVCGEPFHCPICKANVFSKVKKANGDIVYRCHGCDTEYAGE